MDAGAIREVKMNKLLLTAVLCWIQAASWAAPTTTLDFEGPFPLGLAAATSYGNGTPITEANLIGSHFLSQGVLAEGAVLVDLGYGHAASGRYGLSGTSVGQDAVDYASGYSFEFFTQIDSSVRAQTDYFSIAPDRGGSSFNSITLSAFDYEGKFVGSRSWIENVSYLGILELDGIGMFHKVVVDPIAQNPYYGGMAMDLVSFGTLVAEIPEPESIALFGLALAGLGLTRRKAKQAVLSAP